MALRSSRTIPAPAEALLMPADEQRILSLAQTDPAQFAPIYEHYVDRVYAYCLRRVNDPQEAEDLCSQVFTRVLIALPTYRGGVFAAWLFQIAHNTVVNHYRARRAQVISLDAVDLADENAWLCTEGSDDQRLLRQLLAEMPEDQRDLLALTLDAELTSQEIGTLLGKSAGAVRTQLHRIIKGLRERFHHLAGENLG